MTRTHFINSSVCERAIWDAALGAMGSKGWFPLRAAQQRDAPKSPVPFGFSPESALAALRTLRIDHYSLRHAPCHHPILD